MKILVVDDDATLVNKMRQHLTSHGHAVETACSGEAALNLLKQQSFEVVLTDLKMPEMDGLEILEQMHNRWPEIFGVVFTGYGTIDKAVEAMKLGAFDFLTKPFEMATIYETLDMIQKEMDERKRLKSKFETPDFNTQHLFHLFHDLSEQGASRPICLITDRDPEARARGLGVENQKLIWLSFEETDHSLSPRQLHNLEGKIEDFFKARSGGLVILEGLTTLIDCHGWGLVRSLINWMLENAQKYQAQIIVMVEPEELGAQEFKELTTLMTQKYLDFVAQSLGNTHRLQVIRLLAQEGPQNFNTIWRHSHIKNSSGLAFHLNKLQEGKLVEKKKNGKYGLTPLGKQLCRIMENLEPVCSINNQFPGAILSLTLPK